MFRKIKRNAFATMIALTCSVPLRANSDAEVKDYLITTTQVVQQHIELLDAADNAGKAAEVLKKYAAAMKPVMKKSAALKKKYPKAFAGESLKVEMEAMHKTMMTMNGKLGQAKQKFGHDKKFKQGEKALLRAGLFGSR